MKIMWPEERREPTAKELARYRRWVKYLSDSKLTTAEIRSRAREYAEQGREPENG